MKKENRLKRFCETIQYVKNLVTNMYNSPNYIKIPAIQFKKEINSDSRINFTIRNTY